MTKAKEGLHGISIRMQWTFCEFHARKWVIKHTRMQLKFLIVQNIIYIYKKNGANRILYYVYIYCMITEFYLKFNLINIYLHGPCRHHLLNLYYRTTHKIQFLSVQFLYALISYAVCMATPKNTQQPFIRRVFINIHSNLNYINSV